MCSRLGLSYLELIDIGQQCKRVLDVGRIMMLESMGFDVELLVSSGGYLDFLLWAHLGSLRLACFGCVESRLFVSVAAPPVSSFFWALFFLFLRLYCSLFLLSFSLLLPHSPSTFPLSQLRFTPHPALPQKMSCSLPSRAHQLQARVSR